eukprot:TRINITY_DN12111_c0_g1_i2.p1 TRINITY_DN12111_c0_g1~~TRINITY_DN12111_c0_g1_i2.p1  ORF type:complete len:239 (+),score=34.11 TRINITY_DN12111_c0_g1_i2:74-790(+)
MTASFWVSDPRAAQQWNGLHDAQQNTGTEGMQTMYVPSSPDMQLVQGMHSMHGTSMEVERGTQQGTNGIAVPDVLRFPTGSESPQGVPEPSVPPGLIDFDIQRPLVVKGSNGSVFAVEWLGDKAYFIPTPDEKDYPLRFTQSSEWTRATTVMIEHLPDGFNRDALAEFLVCQGFGGLFDILYVPCEFSDWAPFAYAFCNMTTHEDALRLKQTLHGRAWWLDTEKVCEVRFAKTQGGYG